MKPATASDDNGALSAQKSIFGPECIAIRFHPENRFFKFALRAQKITILGALATQFHEICGPEPLGDTGVPAPSRQINSYFYKTV
ncbi:MAG: hypothetical protein ACK5GN_05665 [Pseudomonadota bacterium]|jgi:hypothetical protein